MEGVVKRSLEEVVSAMEKLCGVFEKKVEEMRIKGKGEEELRQLTQGAMAMKDAAGIYLAWANHYIARLNKTEGLEMSEAETMTVE